jgi:polyhydroxybutyrate depolymerase
MVLAYRTCPEHAGMELYTIRGGGHTWPGSPVSWPTYLGPVNHTINAAQVLWQFFAAHPLP